MKVIFLDVDGPLIPGRQYDGTEYATWFEDVHCHKYHTECIDVIRQICKETGAVVVHNSAHNGSGPEHMLWQARHNKMHDLLHRRDWITGFPNLFERRIDAIKNWLERHPEVTHWCAIDDEHIPHENAILVNFYEGTGEEEYKKALELLT